MKTIIRLVLTVILFIQILTFAQGQNIILKQTNETGIYKKGQKIRVTLVLKENSDDSVSVKIRKNYSGPILKMVNEKIIPTRGWRTGATFISEGCT